MLIFDWSDRCLVWFIGHSGHCCVQTISQTVLRQLSSNITKRCRQQLALTSGVFIEHVTKNTKGAAFVTWQIVNHCLRYPSLRNCRHVFRTRLE